jgi:integrase
MTNSEGQIVTLPGAQMTIKELVTHYTQTELPRLAYSTRAAYESYIASWIGPVWGNHQLGEVKAVSVEAWLATLPLANGTKAKIRNIMCSLFSHACRWEFTERNPIIHVRQATQRAKQPVILSNDEISRLLTELPEPARTAVFLALATGLRVSELLALQWQDVDFSSNTITPSRGIVDNHIGGLKTVSSAAPVPASEQVTAVLKAWHKRTLYPAPTDWVFPSPKMGGKQPYWQDSLMRKVIWPAAKRAGISKRIGWHTFRRSLATLLVGVGAPVKLTQEMMRHANARITLELYAQSTMTAKQELQAQIVSEWTPNENGGDDGTRTRGLCRDRAAF